MTLEEFLVEFKKLECPKPQYTNWNIRDREGRCPICAVTFAKRGSCRSNVFATVDANDLGLSPIDAADILCASDGERHRGRLDEIATRLLDACSGL